MTSGYTDTPLARKLSLKDGQRVWWHAMPATVRAEILAAGIELRVLERPGDDLDVAHVFTERRAELEAQLIRLRHRIRPGGMIWVSWPKKASNRPTDLTENVVRELALPLGLVDTKVCAVDQTWSALKLVIRKALRQRLPTDRG